MRRSTCVNFENVKRKKGIFKKKSHSVFGIISHLPLLAKDFSFQCHNFKNIWKYHLICLFDQITSKTLPQSNDSQPNYFPCKGGRRKNLGEGSQNQPQRKKQ